MVGAPGAVLAMTWSVQAITLLVPQASIRHGLSLTVTGFGTNVEQFGALLSNLWAEQRSSAADKRVMSLQKTKFGVERSIRTCVAMQICV